MKTVLPKRLIVLAAVVAAGFSTVFLLPKVPPMRSSRLADHLPEQFANWEGVDVPISERERKVLAKDTRFERKSFALTDDLAHLEARAVNSVDVSIVFSGKDLNNSIHRPETCLRAQGWSFARMRFLTLPGAAGGEALPVKEILCYRNRLDQEGKPVPNPKGGQLQDWQLVYYTFIGHTVITPGHYARTFQDIRDRVLGGYDQTWAYATFSTLVTGEYMKQGFDLGDTPARDVDATGAYLGAFINELVPRVLSPPPTDGSESSAAR